GSYVFHTGKHRQSSSVGVVPCQESRLIIHASTFWKHKANTVFLVQIENYDMTFVFLRIEGRHLARVKERRCVPLDLFADLAIYVQNDPPQRRYDIREWMLELLHVRINLFRL